MTPAQLTSLKGEIRSRLDCVAGIEARDLDAIAEIISVGRKTIQSRFVTARTVLAECAEGQAILDTLKAVAASNSAVNWAITFLGQDSGLDVGNAATQGMVDQLVAAGALTAAQATSLKNLANLPQSISRTLVEAALFYPDGTMK